MSALKAKAKENANLTNSATASDEMTRPQALAVFWTGAEWLAMHEQAITFNDKKTGVFWVGLKDVQAVRVGTSSYTLQPLATNTANTAETK